MGFGQKSTDYKDYRNELAPVVCGFRDSVTLNQIQSNLENFDTTLIIANKVTYYIDLAGCYYEQTIHPIDSSGYHLSALDSMYIWKTIECYNKALFHEPKNTQAIWNLLFSYSMVGECEKSLYYLNLYKAYEKKKYWDKEQIGYLIKRCSVE